MKVVRITENPTMAKHANFVHKGFAYGLFGSDLAEGFTEGAGLQVAVTAAAKKLGYDDHQGYYLEQQHAGTAVILESILEHGAAIGDAIVTKLTGKVICVNTADCVPIICIDPRSKVIGVIHAGWRGQMQGIIQNTIKAMICLGADVSAISALIGPCIRRNSYQVQMDFFDEMVGRDPNSRDFFFENEDGVRFDLAANATSLLMRAGVKQIFDVCVDTYKDQRFFSHRREGASVGGRNVSAVVML